MQKVWGAGILASLLVLTVITILISSESELNNNFSGMASKQGSLDYCTAKCNDYAKFYFKQSNSNYNILSYTINEGDYFVVSLDNLTDNIVAVYKYNGLILNDPKSLNNKNSYELTDNYLKLNMVYAKVQSRTTRKQDAIVYPFNCNGKEVLVPILPVQVLNKEIALGRESAVRGYYLANVQIKPFQDANGWLPFYNSAGFSLKDYVMASILVRGDNPLTFDKPLSVKSSLLVDLDGDENPGGEVIDMYEQSKLCSNNIYRGNTLGQKYTSYRTKAEGEYPS
ncbi:hypothetical protein J4440_04925 [Candidatus Woesearchaeota archaeon]|nr:hypothetical protein [Candidatus Woesearchaeota archaeon]